MKNSYIFMSVPARLALCAGLLLCGSFVRAQSVPNASGSGPVSSIAGSILEAGTNWPLAEVSIRIVRLQPAISSAKSDLLAKSRPDGSFEFPHLSVGTYLISPEPPPGYSADHFANSSRQVVIRKGGSLSTLRFYLTREKTIQGKVIAEDGTAVPGVTVKAFSEVSDPGFGVDRLTELSSASTDLSGSYVLKGLSGNGFILMAAPPLMSAIKPGRRIAQGHSQMGLLPTYWPSEPLIESAIPLRVSGSSAEDINIILRRGPIYSISGKVEGDSGHSNAGLTSISVTPTNFNNLDMTPLRRTAPVGTDGSFHIEGLSAGNYSVQWSGPNLGELLTSQDITLGGTSSDVRVVLSSGKSASLEGKITVEGMDGRDLSGALLQVIPLSPGLNGIVPVEAHPAADGRISITGLAPAKYFLRILAPGGTYIKEISAGGRPVARHILDLSNGSGSLSIVLQAGSGSVNGKIEDSESDDSTNAAAVLLYSSQFPDEKPRVLFTQGERFSLAPVAPGHYLIIAVESYDPDLFVKSAFKQQISRKMLPVDVAENQNATINLSLLSEKEILTAAMQADLF